MRSSFTPRIAVPAGHRDYLIAQRKKLPSRTAAYQAPISPEERAEITKTYDWLTQGIAHAGSSPAIATGEPVGPVEQLVFERSSSAARAVDELVARYASRLSRALVNA